MVMMVGGFLLGQYTPAVAAMLHDEIHCAFYHDVESCLSRAFHFIMNPGAGARSRKHLVFL